MLFRPKRDRPRQMNSLIHDKRIKMMSQDKRYVKIVFIGAMMIFYACIKDQPIPDNLAPVMPPLTHQGLNTFGCYVDGELFVAGGGDSYWDLPPLSGSYNEGDGTLLLQASRYIDGDFYDDIRIQVLFIDSEGEYSFYSEGDELRGYTGTGGNCNYFYDTEDYGILHVTYLNRTSNIIAGKFNANLVNVSCETDTLMKITDGRFDLKY